MHTPAALPSLTAVSAARWWPAAARVLLVAAVGGLYHPVLGFPFIGFDDVGYILQNPQVNGADVPWIDRLLTPKVGYVVPVTVNFERLLFELSEGRAVGFHAAALVLHAGGALQLLSLCRALGLGLPAALCGALLFAVHPLCVQPVAWAVCLKDLLMANLALGATRCFVHVSKGRRGQASGQLAVAAVVLSALANLAKPAAAPTRTRRVTPVIPGCSRGCSRSWVRRCSRGGCAGGPKRCCCWR